MRLLQDLSASAVFSAAEIRDRLFGNLSLFSGNQPQHDDQTIVVVKGVVRPSLP